MHHTRVLRPADGIIGFYDGREAGYRFSDDPNWVDEGALSLGICSYAIFDGDDALVYDTHVSVEHGRFIRDTLEAEGVSRFRVVLSHQHLDHIAGTEAFAESEVISSARTAEALRRDNGAIQAGTLDGPPAINPLIVPTLTFEGSMELEVGRFGVEMIHLHIHSDDAVVLWLPEQRLLLAGDTLEDTVTFVDEPESFDAHLRDLERLRDLEPRRILPNHGARDIIASGGYPPGLIQATQMYIETLRRCRSDDQLRATSLRELVAEEIDAGWLHYFEPYEAVHRHNVGAVLALGA